ncbi:hypothetical protein ACFQ1S_21160, partial [Kibdelosporangium lantanae]
TNALVSKVVIKSGRVEGVMYAHDGAWWLIAPPGLLIVMTVCAFNFIGDGLRDAFDVKFGGR